MIPIGYVKTLNVRPVIPLEGQEIDEVLITKYGVSGDMLYSLIDESKSIEYSWMKPLDKEDLRSFKLYKTYRKEGKWKVKIISQEGDICDIEDDQFLAYLAGRYKHYFELVKHPADQRKDIIITIEQASTDTKLTRGEYDTPLSPHILWRIQSPIHSFLQTQTIQMGEIAQVQLSPVSPHTYKAKVVQEGIIKRGDHIKIVTNF